MSRSRKHYILALDDTGNSAPLMTPNLEPGDIGKHGPVGLGAFILREDHQDSFENDWYDLRCAIQKDLQLSAPPPIHLRLMYGRTMRKEARAGVPNPYYLSSQQEVEDRFPTLVHHLTKAAALVARYTRRRRIAAVHTQLSTRAHLIGRMHEHYGTGKAAKDLLQFKTRNRRAFNGFFRELTRPLLPPITTTWLFLDELVSDAGSSTAHVQFDKFAGTENLASEEAHRLMRDIGELDQLEPSVLCTDSDEDAMIQAADLGIYLGQRVQQGDKTAKDILRHDFRRLTTATLRVIMQRVHRRGTWRRTAMHYAAAWLAASTRAPNFVKEYLKTPQEVAAEFRAVGEQASFVSIFREDP